MASGKETQISDEESHLTLFDTGPDSQSLVRNAKAMQVPVDDISRIILSHCDEFAFAEI